MASTSSLLRRAVGLLAAGAVVGSLAIAVPGIASATPPSSDRFSCAGGDYFRLEEGQLTQASDPNGTWTTLRASTSVNNAIGFRASDRYIYGMKSGSNHLFKLTASATEDLGEINGLPRDVYNVGAIDQATGKFYVSSSQSSLHEVDIEALTASSVAFDSANFKLGQDVVIVGGWAWSVRGTEVYGIDLADPSQTKSYAFDHTYLQGGVVGGAMWFAEDDSSLLMEIRGTGVAVKFVGVGGASITTSNVAFSATGTGAIDGASCRTTRLTVTPDAQSVNYGDAAPSYTATVTGFILGENASTATDYVAPICTSTYSTTTSVASSPLTISCSGGSAADYTFTTTATSLLTVSYSSDSLSCSAARFVRLTHRDVFVASSLTGIWTKVRSAKPVSNAIAHRAVDQFLYGFARRSNSVFKVGIVGKFNLGAVTNLPVTNYVGADFDSATGLYYVVSVSGSVYRIDLDTMSASLFTLSTSSGSVRAGKDIAIVGGYLWSSASGYIFKANLTTGEVTKYTGWTHGTLGAMWVNADGVTVSGQVRATGEVFSVTDLSAPASSSVSLGTVPTGDKIDGATCR